MLTLRSARVMILAGPFSPKFIAEALVTSEKVGEVGAGSGEPVRLPAAFVVTTRVWSGRGRGISRKHTVRVALISPCARTEETCAELAFVHGNSFSDCESDHCFSCPRSSI